MPDTPGGGSKAGSSFGFLSRKLGPAPVWLWALLAVGAYYLYTKYKSGQSSSQGAEATDPATGVTYAQELSDAEDQITQLQAQLNAQAQGQTAPVTVNVTDTDTDTDTTPPPKPIGTKPLEPGPKPAGTKPLKPGPAKKIPDVAGQRAAYAISAVEAAGFETHTSPLRDPSREYVATGTSPSGSAPAGSTVVINVRAVSATTKAKAASKPARSAPTTLKTVPAVRKTVPLKHPAQRGKAA